MAERHEWGAATRDPLASGADDKRLETMQRRLDKLEKENRGWGLILATLIGGLALIIFIVAKAARPVDELRVGRLVLADKSGQDRAVLAVDEGGAPSLTLLDKHQRARIVIGLAAGDQPQLVFAGTNEAPRIRMSLDGDAAALIQFTDRAGGNRAFFGVGRTGSAGAWVHGTDGREYASLTAGTNFFAALSFLGRSGKERAALGMNAERALMLLTGGATNTTAAFAISAEGLPSVVLNDRDRGSRTSLALNADGTPLIQMADKKGQMSAVSTAKVLLGKDQTVIWQAP